MKISADTVTELTAASGFSPGSYGTPPTSQQLIDQIRAELAMRVEALERQVKANPRKSKFPTAFEIALPKAIAAQQEFENLVANVPEGFRLTTVLYSKIPSEQNARVYAEYNKYVRPDFMRYLALNHAAELTSLGICDFGIERMKKGLDPTDEKGNLYSLNVDHVIERAGGGNRSLQKEVDPQMPPGSPPTYLVNHFSNFILLPKKIHEVKNKLNDLQKTPSATPGESKWVLMMVPEAAPARSGYVCAPQPPKNHFHGVHVHDENAEHYVQHAEFMVDRVRDGLEVFAAGKTLSQAFNEAASGQQAQKERLDTFLKPAIGEANRWLTLAFDNVVKPGKNNRSYRNFSDFYRKKNVAALSGELAGLPIDEAAGLKELIGQIDSALQEQFNRQAQKPVNDNKASAPKRHRRRKNRSHKNRYR